MESTETISQSPRRRARSSAAVRLARRGDADEGDRGQAPATGMRTRWRGRAVTSSSRPERWCGWPAVTVTRPRAPAGRRTGRAGRREVDELALAGATAQHGLVAPAHALDEHLLAAPDPGLVPGQRGAVDHGLEPVEALGDDLGRDERRTPWPAARVPGRGEKMKVNALS